MKFAVRAKGCGSILARRPLQATCPTLISPWKLPWEYHPVLFHAEDLRVQRVRRFLTLRAGE